MSEHIELRFKESKISSSDDGMLKVSGYVNKVGEQSEVLRSKSLNNIPARNFVESISKGAFKNAILNSKHDIDFLAEHDKSKLLASTRNGSLSLTEDDNGLFMEAEIAPTSWGQDIYTLIKSGLYKNMSFGFKVIKDEWKKVKTGLYERVIKDLDLLEVSVVKNPAYASSTIEARGFDLIENVVIPKHIITEERNMENNNLDEKVAGIEEAVSVIAEGVNTILDLVQSKNDTKDETPAATDEQRKDEDKVEDDKKSENSDSEKTDDAAKDDKADQADQDKKDDAATNDGEEKKDEDDKDEEKRCGQIPAVSELRDRLAALKQEG